MGWPQCNQTVERLKITETNLFDSHDFTFHKLILVISAVFGAIAIIVSLFLMFMHATHYSRPTEQRHIIRILFMVPIYALVSFLSIVFYYHSVYYEVLRDCYEAFAIASFFSLLCAYLAPDLHNQKEYFRTIKPRPWIWPASWFQKCCGGARGCLRTPRSGLTWFNVIWVAVFQYCFIRVAMTIAAVLSQYWDRYCLESLNPAFAHIWIMLIEGAAVTVAMYCLIQFFIQIRLDIAQHRPFLKILAIKLVIFLSFWQTIVLSFLTSAGAMKASNKIQTPDIKVGIPSLLLCIEMALFSVLHIWAFPYKPYTIGSKAWQTTFGHLKESENPRYHGGPLGVKAGLDCFNPWDLVKATGRSARWLFVGRKHRMDDPSYANMSDAQKMNELDSRTSYSAAGSTLPAKETGILAEGDRLMTSTQQQPHVASNPYAHESDSSNEVLWDKVEAKEYIQDQNMRKQNPQRDNFQTAQPTSYEAKYAETQYQQPQGPPSSIQYQQPQGPPSSIRHDPVSNQQMSGVLRPAGTGAQYDRPTNLPFVTRQDINDMQQAPGQTPHTNMPRTLR